MYINRIYVQFIWLLSTKNEVKKRKAKRKKERNKENKLKPIAKLQYNT